MRKEHELKCWPAQFHAIRTGAKPFEVRQNDRGFEVSDFLRLREFDPRPFISGYSGDEVLAQITYIYDSGPDSPTHGALAPGWIVMGIRVISVTRTPGFYRNVKV